MNMEKLTNKTREALLESQNIAVGNRNTELRDIHVLAALMRQEDGLVPSLLEKLGVSRKLFNTQVDEALAKLPTVEGSEQQVYQSREFSTLLVDAARQAESMQDEYVSVEHLLLAMFQATVSCARKLSCKTMPNRRRYSSRGISRTSTPSTVMRPPRS